MTILWVIVGVSWFCFIAGYVIGKNPKSWRELLFPR